MTVSEVMDVASVLAHLQKLHNIDTDPGIGPLRLADFRYIAEKIAEDWNTYGIARELALDISRRVPEEKV